MGIGEVMGKICFLINSATVYIKRWLSMFYNKCFEVKVTNDSPMIKEYVNSRDDT